MGTGPLSDPRGRRSNPGAGTTVVPVNEPDRRPDDPSINDRRFSELDVGTLHDLLRLRVDVFVVEQDCAYPELDGRDPEPDTRHVWLDGPDARPAAMVRVLVEPDGTHRVGRITTRADARGSGLAGVLLTHVHDTTPGRIVLDAQTYLVPWYTSLGYEPTGNEFLEDGIAHVPMARPGR